MSYSQFTIKAVERDFHLSLEECPRLFDSVPKVVPSARLVDQLQLHTPLALAIHTEKARSELLIAPILVEVREKRLHQVSLFSGVDFTVDESLGLAGTCDFMLTRSAQQQFIEAPVLVIVEAKNENIKGGLGQCIAAMVGAWRFNEKEGTAVASVFGAVTTGTNWRFLRLQGAKVTLDTEDYYLVDIGLILGILLHMVGDGEPASLVA